MTTGSGGTPASGPWLGELGRATILIAATCLMVLAAIGFSVAEIRIKILEQAEAGFRLDAHVEVSDVQADLTAAASAAETAGRFSATAVGINPIGFSGFLGGITEQYPWIAAIEWVPKIDHAQRRGFVDTARHVLPGFQIREIGAAGKLVSAKSRPVYFPVTVVEPLSLESRVVGIDLGTIAEVRNVLDGAAESGELRASGILSGTREVGKSDAVILASPVYNDMPVGGLAPAVWRRQNLRGFALAVVDLQRVLDHATAQSSGVGLTLNLMTRAPQRGDRQDPAVFAVTSQLTMGGRQYWLTVAAPRVAYLPSPIIYWLALGAAILVIAVVLVAGVSARSGLKRSLVIRRLHLEMAAAAAFSRDILDTLREPVVIVDSRAGIITTNRAWNDWRRSAGAEDGSDDGAYLRLIVRDGLMITRTHELGLITAVDAVLQGVEDDRECDVKLVDSQGGELWFTIRIRAFRHGSERHALIAHTDISRLKRAEHELRQLAITDGLTQVANRRHFDERIQEEVDRSQRYGRPLVLLLLDIDHFKKVNDTYGHPAGDAVLRSVAEVCRASTRTLDLVARFGGEEFAMLLPETDIPGALQLAERIREEIAALPVNYGRHTIRVTASIGLAATQDGDRGSEQLIKAADEGLYAAKQGGRNRVTCAA